MKHLMKMFEASLFALFISVSFAQEKPEAEKNGNTIMHHMDHKHHNHKSNYVTEINNEIKALTDEELNQLLNGEGMGLAKAAELNNYPGPRHVLDLSSELDLTQEQQEKTQALFNSMQTEAKQLGKSIIENEKELNLFFKTNSIDDKSILDKINEIAQLNGKLRFIHLAAHLKQKEILTSEQVNTYNKLRGYN